MRRITKAALAYFGLVFGAGFILGSIRVPLLVPRLGERTAELIEMPLMLGVVVVAARYVVRRFQLPGDAVTRMAVGAIALGLLAAAEVALAVVLQDQSIAQYLASRDPVSGSVYLVMLGVFAAMPSILVHTRGKRRNGTGHAVK